MNSCKQSLRSGFEKTTGAGSIRKQFSMYYVQKSNISPFDLIKAKMFKIIKSLQNVRLAYF